MDIKSYLVDVTGHMIQMLAPMFLYFLCVPDEMYRTTRKKTALRYGVPAVLILFAGSALKMDILHRFPDVPSGYIASVVLFVEFVLLAMLSHAFVRVPAWPNHTIILLVFFWGTMQYNISNLVLSFRGNNGIYGVSTVLVFAAFTALLFPVAYRLLVPFSKTYLLTKAAVRSPAQILVFIMATISIIQLFLTSWEEHWHGFFTLAVLSVCITVTHWILIRQVALQEQQTRMELHLLSSQIRPHFILNTLNAICNLVDDDPGATRQAIYDFSGYLRMNYQALEKETPVRFEEELEHTMCYLSIEKLRFRDDIDIETDTPVTDFLVPALTVQPMVENAIRHGLRAKEGAGHLLLKTRQTPDAYEIVIRDDGVGMPEAGQETETDAKGKELHTGLINVRDRLRRMVGGTLEIDSAPGEGTTVTIRIPRDARIRGRAKK